MRIITYNNTKPIILIFCVTVAVGVAVYIKRNLDIMVTEQDNPKKVKETSLNDAYFTMDMGNSEDVKVHNIVCSLIEENNCLKTENKEIITLNSIKNCQVDKKNDKIINCSIKPQELIDNVKISSGNKTIVDTQKNVIKNKGTDKTNLNDQLPSQLTKPITNVLCLTNIQEQFMKTESIGVANNQPQNKDQNIQKVLNIKNPPLQQTNIYQNSSEELNKYSSSFTNYELQDTSKSNIKELPKKIEQTKDSSSFDQQTSSNSKDRQNSETINKQGTPQSNSNIDKSNKDIKEYIPKVYNKIKKDIQPISVGRCILNDICKKVKSTDMYGIVRYWLLDNNNNIYSKKLIGIFEIPCEPLVCRNTDINVSNLLLLLLEFKEVVYLIEKTITASQDTNQCFSEKKDICPILLQDVKCIEPIFKEVIKLYEEYDKPKICCNSNVDVDSLCSYLLEFANSHQKNLTTDVRSSDKKSTNHKSSAQIDKSLNECTGNKDSKLESLHLKPENQSNANVEQEPVKKLAESLDDFDTIKLLVALFETTIKTLNVLENNESSILSNYFPYCNNLTGELNEFFWEYKGGCVIPFFRVMMDNENIISFEDVLNVCLNTKVKSDDNTSDILVPKDITFKSGSFVSFIADRSKVKNLAKEILFDKYDDKIFCPFPIHIPYKKQHFILQVALTIANFHDWSGRKLPQYDLHVVKGTEIFTHGSNDVHLTTFNDTVWRMQYYGTLFIYRVVDEPI